MSRRSCKIVRTLTQRGVALADAKVQARDMTQPHRAPWRMVDVQTNKTVATLSVRKSRAARHAKVFGADARLVR